MAFDLMRVQGYRQWRERVLNTPIGCAIWSSGFSLLGLVTARYDLLPKLFGFGAIILATVIAGIGPFAGLVALLLTGREPHRRRGVLLSMAWCGALCTLLAAQLLPGRDAPMINDVTTDLESPPAFVALRGIPDIPSYDDTVKERWRDLHARHYGDLRPITLPVPPSTAMALARRLSVERGWTVAVADGSAGRLEAVDQVSPLRFEDNIVVVASPATGGGSVVHARSRSLEGRGDHGVNARRLRGFLRALTEAADDAP